MKSNVFETIYEQKACRTEKYQPARNQFQI